MSPRTQPADEKQARNADKGVALLILFICVPFCAAAGMVAWMAG
ncbi:hypothetical protein [Devosia sp. LjRoot3]